jgi:glycosyltransferase involved in cell wall biosynthesis
LFDRFSGYESQIAARLHGPYHAAVVEHFWCASYADLLRPHCQRLILDLHNVESTLARTHARASSWPESWMSDRFADAYEELEGLWLKKFDTLLVTSPDDLRRVRHPNVVVYPNAIPVAARPAVVHTQPDAVIFTGNLEYHPNVEAIRWFRDHVWPLVKDQAEWRLAGVNPDAVRSLVSADPRIRLIGPVEDAIATIAQAQIAIVPLQSGSGTRFKILEAWAAQRPVVSTSIGAEGLGAIPGTHLLIADTPADFAAAIQRLLANPRERETIAQAGRDFYLRNFTWPAAWRLLERSGVL